MENFSYLSVLISIVLGLGIANLLIGVAALIRQRSRVTPYWPAVVWMMTLFLIHVQTWWAMFGLRQVREWDFAAFAIVLMQPVLLFVMTALIVPESTPSAAAMDSRSVYFREARWFFGSLFLVLCVSLARDLVLVGRLPETPNLLFHILFMAGALIGAFFRNGRVHMILAPLALAAVVGYVALLFTRLM
jgi:hypothetical protein